MTPETQIIGITWPALAAFGSIVITLFLFINKQSNKMTAISTTMAAAVDKLAAMESEKNRVHDDLYEKHNNNARHITQLATHANVNLQSND